MLKTSPNNNKSLNKRLQTRYQVAKKNHLIRNHLSIASRSRAKININGQSYINFSSNDYLGLSSSPLILKAFKQGAKRYGFGSGSSVAISGYSMMQKALEKKFATFLNREAAMFFNSGYLANLGVLTALSNRHDTILSDKLSHASILDGIQLTRAVHRRFSHSNLAHLTQRLQNAKGHRFVITESVFSIAGDIAPIRQMALIAKRYNATLIVDDAHGFGYLGKNGRGICEHCQLSQEEVPCLVVPLGKAAGGYGAVVAGRRNIIESIIQQARSYRYTTALPAAIVAANIEALSQLEKTNRRRCHLRTLSQYFIEQALLLNLPMFSTHHTPIKTIVVGSNSKAQQIQSYLLENGLLVSSIRPPTVPHGAACIRVSLNYYHSKKLITLLLNCLKRAYERY
jgi:8-amino-7-oxononanoate synthase